MKGAPGMNLPRNRLVFLLITNFVSTWHSQHITCRGISGFVIGCHCGALGRGLTTCTLWGRPKILDDSFYVSCHTGWHTGVWFLYFCVYFVNKSYWYIIFSCCQDTFSQAIFQLNQWYSSLWDVVLTSVFVTNANFYDLQMKLSTDLVMQSLSLNHRIFVAEYQAENK